MMMKSLVMGLFIMTLPRERFNALLKVRRFLRALLDPKATPRIPKAIRKEAYYTLKHYPSDWEIERIAKKCPDILGDDTDA